MNYSEDQLLWYQLDEGIYTIGLTNKALDDWGKIEFISLLPVGTIIAVGDSMAEVEAEKAVTDIPAPVAGEIVAVFDGPLTMEVPEKERQLLKIKAK